MVFLTAWHAALGVVTVFTGFWIFMFVNTLPYSVTLWWDTYIVSSLFSAVLFVYAVTRRHTITWLGVVMLGTICLMAFYIFVFVSIVTM